jgi:phosphopantothenoylcysteine synthetase/decarboxylase
MAPAHRFLVTAGNTRERIDSVRDWGNIFTGNTGYGIARALAEVGEVDLLTSNLAHLAEAKTLTLPHAIRSSTFKSHEELRGALAALMGRTAYSGIFMTAAVSDYKPQRVYEVLERRLDAGGVENWVVRDVQAGKVKSTHREIAILGSPTEKIVDLFRGEWGYRGLLVKFKLEVGISREALLKVGEASRVASGADYLVANTLEMVSGEGAGAYLLSAAGNEWVPREELAARLAALAARAAPL